MFIFSNSDNECIDTKMITTGTAKVVQFMHSIFRFPKRMCMPKCVCKQTNLMAVLASNH